MKRKNSIILIIIFFFVAGNLSAEFDACEFQNNYKKNLKIDSKQALDNEYKRIYTVDQNNRHEKENQLLDLKNLLKIAVLISDYGFPSNTIDQKIYNSANVVFAHNTICKYLFQSIVKAYKKGEIPDKSMEGYLWNIFTQSLNYPFCETIGVSTKSKIDLMIKHLDFLFGPEYNISNLCQTANDCLHKENTEDHSVVCQWNDRATVYKIIMDNRNQYYLYEEYWKRMPQTFLLKRINSNLFIYDNEYNPIQYIIVENGIEVTNKYCDSQDEKYFYKKN